MPTLTLTLPTLLRLPAPSACPPGSLPTLPTLLRLPPSRFARKLKKVTAEQGARFVSYDAPSGTWKFEVEHFSKYGLEDSDEEEEEEEGQADSDEDLVAYGVRGRQGGAAGGAARDRAQQQQGGEGDDAMAADREEEAEDGGQVAMGAAAGQDGTLDSKLGAANSAGGGEAARSRRICCL